MSKNNPGDWDHIGSDDKGMIYRNRKTGKTHRVNTQKELRHLVLQGKPLKSIKGKKPSTVPKQGKSGKGKPRRKIKINWPYLFFYAILPVLWRGGIATNNALKEYNLRPAAVESYYAEKTVERQIKVGFPYNNIIKLFPKFPREQYKQIRKQAFELVNINSNEASDNEKRYSFYAELGYAVNADTAATIYIPFKTWADFVNKNIDDDKLKVQVVDEDLQPSGEKGHLHLSGKAYHISEIDSNGVSDLTEWGIGLQKMGYKIPRELVDDVIAAAFQTNTPGEGGRKKLLEILQESRINKTYLADRQLTAHEIPIEKLIKYVSSDN